MTTEQKLKAAIAFCDWAIECDKRRTQGEWKKVQVVATLKDPYGEVHRKNREAITHLNLDDATFIAGSTVWSAPLAKGMRTTLCKLRVRTNKSFMECRSQSESGLLEEDIKDRDKLLEAFTDEMLTPFVKS